MGEMMARVSRLAGGRLDEFTGNETAAGTVNGCSQPVEQRAVATGCEICLNGGVLLERGMEELGGIEIAERVGRKVSDQAGAPVDVLKASVRIVRHEDAEELLEARVPFARKIMDVDLAGKQGAFDSETEQNVKIVGDFVCFDPDVTSFCGVDDLHHFFQ